MNEFTIEEPPSQLRMIATLLAVVLLSAFCTPLLELLREKVFSHYKSGIDANSDPLTVGALLTVALLLCALTLKSSGLGIGDPKKWKRRPYHIAFVWILPPLLVLSLYTLTTKPYTNRPMAWWLMGSVAQELLFAGFIYGQMGALFGKPAESTRGAFSAPILVTALLYAAYHWPNLQSANFPVNRMTLDYAQFKMAYAFLGFAWILNLRRWTGSIWPGVANHILVNYLATKV